MTNLAFKPISELPKQKFPATMLEADAKTLLLLLLFGPGYAIDWTMTSDSLCIHIVACPPFQDMINQTKSFEQI